jgi:hypothetical protein
MEDKKKTQRGSVLRTPSEEMRVSISTFVPHTSPLLNKAGTDITNSKKKLRNITKVGVLLTQLTYKI